MACKEHNGALSQFLCFTILYKYITLVTYLYKKPNLLNIVHVYSI